MIRVRPALALVAPVLLLASACVDSPTAPSRQQLAPTPEPSLGLFTPLLLPPGADWGHYFNSFDPDRHLSAYVIHYPDGTVTGRGIFIVPGLGIGRLRVTTLVSTSQECVPWATPCSDPGATNIPEGSTVSGDGTIGLVPITFTLELESHLAPPGLESRLRSRDQVRYRQADHLYDVHKLYDHVPRRAASRADLSERYGGQV